MFLTHKSSQQLKMENNKIIAKQQLWRRIFYKSSFHFFSHLSSEVLGSYKYFLKLFFSGHH